MNRDQFISYLTTPEKMGATDAVQLEGVVKEFPYFQTAQLLYVKALHNQDSIHYNNQLKSTAIYAGDRKMLYRLINYKPKVEALVSAEPIVAKPAVVEQKSIVEEPKKEERKHEVKVIPRVVVIDPNKNMSPFEGEYIKNVVDASIEIAVSDTNKPADYFFDDVTDDEPQINSDVAPEVHSFSEWMKVMKGKNLSPRANPDSYRERGETQNSKPETSNPKRKKTDSIIDKFIKDEPRITKPKSDFYKSGNMAKQSVSEDDGLVTETLAKLYIKQGHYPKAVRSYMRLIELYPAKQVYYQQQIDYVRELQNGK